MSGREEHAERGRAGTFPESWGVPPGTPDSDLRAAWIKIHARAEAAVAPYRQLAARDHRFLHTLRMVLLRRRKNPPA
jgi:hypothetical protein